MTSALDLNRNKQEFILYWVVQIGVLYKKMDKWEKIEIEFKIGSILPRAEQGEKKWQKRIRDDSGSSEHTESSHQMAF